MDKPFRISVSDCQGGRYYSVEGFSTKAEFDAFVKGFTQAKALGPNSVLESAVIEPSTCDICGADLIENGGICPRVTHTS